MTGYVFPSMTTPEKSSGGTEKPMLPKMEASLFKYSLIADIISYFNSTASKITKKGKRIESLPFRKYMNAKKVLYFGSVTMAEPRPAAAPIILIIS